MSVVSWLTLSLTQGLGPIISGRLVEKLGDASAAANASHALLRTIEGVGAIKASAIASSLGKAREEAARELDRATASSVRIVCLDDADYPPLLRTIHGPPCVLYIKGTLEPRDIHSIGIVGSRKCSVYGREQAERFGSNLAGVGMTIISGGARGIDTHAHHGALVPKNGRTIAVFGCGVDIVYPPENARLFERIQEAGALISEFPLGTAPTPENFPRRNRIVSGLSRGLLVVEADERSGALITARIAADDHNRPVFAIPGRIDNPLSAGPHKLIRDGAALVEKISDVIDHLGPLPDFPTVTSERAIRQVAEPVLFDPAPVQSKAALPPMTADQQKIVAALSAQSLGLDAIAEQADLQPHVVMRELTMLTLRGAVTRTAGQQFTIRSPSQS